MKDQPGSFPKVGVAVIIMREKQVLLLRRRNSHGAGSWAVPGGHLEFGESPEQCGARETHEESGLKVSGLRFFALTNDVFERENKHYITIWLLAEDFSGEPMMNAPEEMSDIAWFQWDHLPTPLFLPFQNLLDGKSLPADALQNQLRAVYSPVS